MIVAIHQPNYFPWMGYFDKINRCDKFIFLTDSFRSKNDKYLTRTRIINNNSKTQYLTIPLGINQVKINQLPMPKEKHWKVKILNIIKESYRSSYYFEEVYADVKKLTVSDYEYFSDYSINIIKFLIEKLNINTSIYLDKEFNEDFGKSNQRNIALCKKVGGNVYLSGDGASVYNDIQLFKDHSLELLYQNYEVPNYSQNSNKFIPGLSILDVIFNCGYHETEKLIKQSN